MDVSWSKECNSLVRQIWLWTIENKIWVSATHMSASKKVLYSQQINLHFDI